MPDLGRGWSALVAFVLALFLLRKRKGRK